ncbi:MAG: adenylate/guanylate cyclase domain-containing protein [Anaerolineae bacterium]
MNSDEIVKTSRVVLFTDIHNFSIATKVLAKRRYAFLQELYETLGDIVVGHQGELVKYLGDGLLSVFPAGLEQKAVAGAVAMREAFAEMARQWGLPADTELEVGIDVGEVAEGVFGHRTLRQREVYGEAVNRAGRVGHHRGVAITERVYEKVRSVYAVCRLPDVTVKWQEEPLKVWEVEQ